MQELIGHAYSLVHIASAVLAQVDDEACGAFGVQVSQGGEELLVGRLAELVHADETEFGVGCWLNNKLGIHGVDGYVAACDGIVEQSVRSCALDTEFDLCAFLAAQRAHHFLIVDFLAYEGGVIHGDQFVPRQHTHAFTRTAGDDRYDADGVLLDGKLHTDTGERAG